MSVVCHCADHINNISHVREYLCIYKPWAFQAALVVKTLPVKAGDTGDESLFPGSGRSPGGRNANPLQHIHLENSMDWGAWWATIHGGCKESDTTEWAHTHANSNFSKFASCYSDYSISFQLIINYEYVILEQNFNCLYTKNLHIDCVLYLNQFPIDEYWSF